jgi:hypothetical protein
LPQAKQKELQLESDLRDYGDNDKGRVNLQPKPRTESSLTSWNDFCRLVLEIIEELSPCAQPTLFLVAANRGLQRFGDGTLDDLRKLLGQGVQELKSRGLVEISGGQLVIAAAGSAGAEHILDLTADVEFQPQSVKEKPAGRAGDDILQLTAELELQPPSVREQSARQTRDEHILDLTADVEFQPQSVMEKPAGRAGDDILQLTAEFELQPQSVREQSARQTRDEDILDLTAELELHEAEDLLELTAELEFSPSLRPSKLDKVPRDLQQLQTPAPGTGRPKGAAEPTREEIIAAMRRFVSDD